MTYPPPGANGKIVKRQTTYWDVELDVGGIPEIWRIDFKRKREFRFVTPEFGSMEIRNAHWALDEYVAEAWEALYVSSPTSDVDGVLRSLATVVSEHTNGWRTLSHYLNDLGDPRTILSGGYGLLLRGPSSLARKVSDVLTMHGIANNILLAFSKPVKTKALLLGENFVIADDFVATLRPGTPGATF